MNQATCEQQRASEMWELGEALRAHGIMRFSKPMAEDDPRFEALCADVAANGVIVPVLATAKREIVCVDSLDRWRAAKRMGLTEIPVIVVGEDEVATVALSALLHRRHLTKSARAYLAYPMMERAFQESRQKRVEFLKNPNVSRKSSGETNGKTVEDLADILGIGRNLLFLAQEVHEIFDKDPEFKAEMEPRILAEPIGGEHEDLRPVGLGAVKAGYAGRRLKDGARPPSRQLDLFEDALCRFSYWNGFSEAERLRARQLIRRTVVEMPADLRKEFSTALREAEKSQ